MPYPLGHRGYIGPLFIIQVINIAFNVMKITGNISTISYRILHLILSKLLEIFQLSITVPSAVGLQFQQ